VNRPPEGTEQRWRSKWQRKRDEPVEWSEVSFPATVSLFFGSTPENLANRGKPVAVIPSLGERNDTNPEDGLSWNTTATQPDRILVYEVFTTTLIPVWDHALNSRSVAAKPFLFARFPYEWAELSAAKIESSSLETDDIFYFWNLDNALTKLLDAEAWAWVIEAMKRDTDPLAIGDRILSSRAKCAAWLGFMVSRSNQDLWRGLVERTPVFCRGYGLRHLESR
jgi:hypothetical protein